MNFKQFYTGRSIGFVVVLAVALCIFAAGKLYSGAPVASPAASTAQYVVRDNKIYWDEYMQVQGADNKDYQQLNEWEIKNADAKTFKAIGGDWGKDAGHVFYEGTLAMPASSMPTADFSALASVANSYFIKDSYAVYYPVYSSQGEAWTYTPLGGADASTFEAIKDRPYAKDKNHVYYLGIYDDTHAIDGLDPGTFRIVGECSWAETYHSYAVADAHSVYAIDKTVPGADPATFEIVGLVDTNPDGLSTGVGYAKDKNHVYKNCTDVVPGVSPAQCTADNLKSCEAK